MTLVVPGTMSLVVAGPSVGLRPTASQRALVDANATVSAVALCIATDTDLEHGVVISGLPAAINPRTLSGAGQFELHGAQDAEFTLSFDSPTELTVGPHSMRVSVSNTTGCAVPYHVLFRTACETFDPSLVYVTRSSNTLPPLDRWLSCFGGTVSPVPTQFPGVYVGTITFAAAYTGN